MNVEILAKQKKGIAIALKQFPWLREYDKKSGIYLWDRINKEDGMHCWYIGKAKNLLRRTAQHIVDGQSHLDKSIKAHGFLGGKEGDFGWGVHILQVCSEEYLDKQERIWISRWQQEYPISKTYNVESGGTTGKTIIGEKKQRRDIKWKAEAKEKLLAKYREYFHIVPTPNALKKGTGELKAEPQKLKDEYYNTKGEDNGIN